MSKHFLFVGIILFFFFFIFDFSSRQVVYAKNLSENFNFKIICGEKTLLFNNFQNLDENRSEIFCEQMKCGEVELLKKLKKFELTDKQRVQYLFPEFKNIEKTYFDYICNYLLLFYFQYL